MTLYVNISIQNYLFHVDLKKETAKMIAESVNALVKSVGALAFDMWERKDFRLFVDFNNLDRVEQDRIFNELEVSLLGLYILNFKSASMSKDKGKKVVYTAFLHDIIPAFLNLYVEFGVEKIFVEQWRKLIDLRMSEYTRDLTIALNESKKMKEFKDEQSLGALWARIETITIDCITHIRQGKFEGGDHLITLLRKWFINLDSQISQITNAK